MVKKLPWPQATTQALKEDLVQFVMFVDGNNPHISDLPAC